MNSSMRSARLVAIFLLIAFLLSACENSLWGSYDPELTPDLAKTATDTLSPLAGTATAVAAISQSAPTTTPSATKIPTEVTPGTPRPTLLYEAQSGDSLEVVAIHFGVQPEEITSSIPLPEIGFIPPGTTLIIPNRLPGIPATPAVKLLPDSEVVYAPTAADFDIAAYVDDAGGFLSTFREYLAVPGWTTGAGSIERLAFESSINPRFLLAYLQYKSGWVMGDPLPGVDEAYPLGYDDLRYRGLYQQLRLLVQELDAGYYGWRAGTLTELTFSDGSILRLAPDLNAGTVALQYLFSRHLNHDEWLQAIDPETGFVALHAEMFGDPWARAALVEPLFPPGILQPEFSLPFEVGYLWSLTGGPHPAWEQESALAALDFAPAMAEPGCGETNAWVIAVAPGQIVRSGGGYVLLDLDGDGFEQTGWVVLYMHIATKGRVPAGTWVDAGDHIGHPSCEGGLATGTHVHFARKYNGEWVGAGGALPFILSGWTAHQGDAPYYGTLTKGDQTITSSKTGTHESQIIRQPDE
ncbi:MAG: M23 family metallopeptidase [Chloroflexi bacterium]|nr:M23 family metallopeptidase [Chloroflexota bacterium]